MTGRIFAMVRAQLLTDVTAMGGSPLEELEKRDLVAQISDREGLDAHLVAGSRTLYCGFDPTADSLQAGNLVPLLALRRFQQLGHRPIALVGGATGLIGDPSFKADERSLNDRDLVAHWVERIRAQVSRFIDLEGNNAGLVVNNLDWTRELDVITFLRDIGKHFSVNAMTRKESVRVRLEREDSGISYTEFSYMILQSMDFLELARRYDCTLQVGGSDQWGNITGGMDLVRRVLQQDCFAFTVPLVTQSDGTKFGKTESGTVWLDATKTSPYRFYQFWLNTADADVVNFLKVFSFVELEEIDALGVEVAEQPQRRAAQRRLAEAVTGLVHDSEGLAAAKRISGALFGGAIRSLTESDLEQLRQDGISCTTITDDRLLAVLVESPLAHSRGAARKLVQSKGIRVNDALIEATDAILEPDAALHGRYHLIRRGKKAWHLAVHG